MNLLTLFAGSFAESDFVKLFTDMNPWCIGLFVVGLIFCLVEVFMPGFGFFGIGGGVCIVVGIILRLVTGGNGWMLLYMILIFTVILTAMALIMSKVMKKGKLSKSAMFNVDSSVSEGITEGTKNFAYLLDKVGTTQTVLRPVGKAVFDGEVVDVVARDGFISQNIQVKVIAVEGQRVVVIEQE